MRLFVALPLPEAVCAPLARLAEAAPLGRAVAEENLHLTLAFLGEVERGALPALDGALSGASAPPVCLCFHEVVALGGRQARVVALTASGPEALQGRIVAALRAAGFALPRRRFRPHVTLLRLPRKLEPGQEQRLARFLASLGAPQTGPVSIDRFTLYASHLHPDGASYEPLAEYPLG